MDRGGVAGKKRPGFSPEVKAQGVSSKTSPSTLLPSRSSSGVESEDLLQSLGMELGYPDELLVAERRRIYYLRFASH